MSGWLSFNACCFGFIFFICPYILNLNIIYICSDVEHAQAQKKPDYGANTSTSVNSTSTSSEPLSAQGDVAESNSASATRLNDDATEGDMVVASTNDRSVLSFGASF